MISLLGGFFAGARIGASDHLKKMTAYVAPCDGFGREDYIRESNRNPDSVQVLESQGCPLFRHSFDQPCYSEGFGQFLKYCKQSY